MRKLDVLSQEEILEVHAAVVSARLGGSRKALLAGVDPTFVDGLSVASKPGDQTLIDLDAMNAAGELADGSAPLARWLRNAVALSGSRTEAAVFRKALARVKPEDPPVEEPETALLGEPRDPEILTSFEALDRFVRDRSEGVPVVLYHATWSSYAGNQREELPELLRDPRLHGASFEATEANLDELWERRIRDFPTLVVYPGEGAPRTFVGYAPLPELRAAIDGVPR